MLFVYLSSASIRHSVNRRLPCVSCLPSALPWGTMQTYYLQVPERNYSINSLALGNYPVSVMHAKKRLHAAQRKQLRKCEVVQLCCQNKQIKELDLQITLQWQWWLLSNWKFCSATRLFKSHILAHGGYLLMCHFLVWCNREWCIFYHALWCAYGQCAHTMLHLHALSIWAFFWHSWVATSFCFMMYMFT